MLLFYKSKLKKYGMKRSFKKAKRTMNYMESYGKWYFLTKFCQKKTLVVPTIHSWQWRSLYMNKKHTKNKELLKKTLLLHLFWIIDIWKVKHPLNLKGVIAYPTTFLVSIPNSDPLELYGTIHRWKYRYDFKKNNLIPYNLNSRWDIYKSGQWLTRTYFTFMDWRKKKQEYYKSIYNAPLYDFFNFWFLKNRYNHLVQGRLYCKTYKNPFRYSKVLWLRLLQYPMVYDYRWFSLLTYLARYKLNELLPWELVYQSRDMWTFDPTAKTLQRLLYALTKNRILITEHILVKQWRNLLISKDRLSSLVQVKIRTSPLFERHRQGFKTSYSRTYIKV